MRGITGRTTRTIVLLAALIDASRPAVAAPAASPAALSESPAAPATVTSSDPDHAVSVAPATGSDAGGVGNAAVPVGKTAGKSLPSDVLAAYTLAIAVAPPGCHLSLPLLAAIGQVESGNLAGHAVDAKNRVTPAILGPVLNGRGVRRRGRHRRWPVGRQQEMGPGARARSSSSRPAGAWPESTWTATASETRRTSSTLLVRRWSTCARVVATSPLLRDCVRACSPTTTPAGYLQARARLEGRLRQRRPQRRRRADGLRSLGVADDADARPPICPSAAARHGTRPATRRSRRRQPVRPTPTKPAAPSPPTPSATPDPTPSDGATPTRRRPARDRARPQGRPRGRPSRTPPAPGSPHRRARSSRTPTPPTPQPPATTATPAEPTATPCPPCPPAADATGTRPNPPTRPNQLTRTSPACPRLTRRQSADPDAHPDALTVSRTASASPRTRSAGPGTRVSDQSRSVEGQ